MAESAPFFIVGAGRSGTTLLRLILTGHSRLYIPPETWFLRDLVREFPLQGALAQPQIERAVAAMVHHERWADLDVPADAVRARVAALMASGAMTLRDLVDVVYRHLAQTAGKPRIGDKTPHYFAIVRQLAALYPAARFVHLLRDGHDVAMSWIDAGWQRYYEPGFEWPAAVRCLARDCLALPERVLAVRYEDLVRQPEATTRQICAFLGEAFEPGMLDWPQRAAMVASRDRHLHARLPQPLAESAIGVWRARLSGGACFAMEACLHRELRVAGYDMRFKSAVWRPLFAMVACLLRQAGPLLHRAIPWLQRRGWLPDTCYL